jgi:GxxExxY protein
MNLNREGAKSAEIEKCDQEFRYHDLPQKLNRLSYEVIGAAIEVHRALGPGYFESTYERALSVALKLRGIAFRKQVALPLAYKGVDIGEGRIDMLIAEELVVENKAVEALSGVDVAQLISYLRATRLQLGLLISYNVTRLKDGVCRVVVSPWQIP